MEIQLLTPPFPKSPARIFVGIAMILLIPEVLTSLWCQASNPQLPTSLYHFRSVIYFSAKIFIVETLHIFH